MSNNPTVLEINLSSLEHNLNYFRSKLDKTTKVLVVVKAGGYGSDPILLSRHLEKLDIDYFAVAYVDEGIALRKAGIKTPILVLHPQINNLQLLTEYNLEPNLYSKKIFLSFLELADQLELNQYRIHIKFNTGLNRLGFTSKDSDFVLKKLKQSKSVALASIFSHLVASEDKNEREYTLDQIGKFKDISNAFEDALGFKPMMHMSNTSGILNYPETHFDMVRLGLGLFGFSNQPELNSNLKNVLRLKSVISQIHEIKAGESVGYNRGFTATGNMKAATIPIGHADGFFRSFGHGKVALKINGKRAAVLGNVCMDMIMIDVTDMNCSEGDEVIIFDCQEDVLKLADAADSISYEILTALSNRVKRISV